MKKLVLFVSVILFATACAKSPEEQLISDYEQQIDGNKIDLNLQIVEIKPVGEVTAQDSLSEYKAYLEMKSSEKIESLERSKNIYSEQKDFDRIDKAIKLYQTDYKDTFLEPVYLKVQELEKLGEHKYGDIYQATYTINNPMLNGVEQEVTNKYLINTSKTEILAKVD